MGRTTFYPGDSGSAVTPTTRAKGDLALAIIVRRQSGAVERLAPGARVAPGDSLRFEVAAARPGFVSVVGLDAVGQVTPYAPHAGMMLELPGGPSVALPGAITADETLGAERIVALHCEKARPLDELVAMGKRALAEAGGDPRLVAPFGAPCAEAAFVIEKGKAP
jgi:hypothetical protein